MVLNIIQFASQVDFTTTENKNQYKKRLGKFPSPLFFSLQIIGDYLFSASLTATAHATVIPTIGLLPTPIRPIISTHLKQ